MKVSISGGLVSVGQNSDPDDKKERKSFLMLSKKKFLFLADWFQPVRTTLAALPDAPFSCNTWIYFSKLFLFLEFVFRFIVCLLIESSAPLSCNNTSEFFGFVFLIR